MHNTPSQTLLSESMAISALTLSASSPKLRAHSHSHKSSFRSTVRCDSIRSEKKTKQWAVEGILGIMAASMVAFSGPMAAEATRVEYYATVGEPLCDLKFVRSGLGFCDVLLGDGREAPYNELINVNYTARFSDGTVFDSSYKRGRYLTMRIGVGKILRGLDQGIFGGDGVPPMLVGGHRKLQIPPHLAYGPEPAGCFSGDCNVPGNATLLYDIHFDGIYSGNRKK